MHYLICLLYLDNLDFQSLPILFSYNFVTKINLLKPFNNYGSKQILQISYYTFSIGLLSFLARQTAENLQHRGYTIDILNQFWADSQAFILMAAIIYVIAIIFSKGVEYQEELEETV